MVRTDRVGIANGFLHKSSAEIPEHLVEASVADLIIDEEQRVEHALSRRCGTEDVRGIVCPVALKGAQHPVVGVIEHVPVALWHEVAEQTIPRTSSVPQRLD